MLETLETVPLKGYTLSETAQLIGVKTRRVKFYAKLLRESCPDEFDHPLGSSFYSRENYKAIAKVRALFLKGATLNQVKSTLRNEGI